MRILIVGAGIAGLSLAAFLRDRPHDVTIVERSPDQSHLGYALSLWPLATRVLIGLDAIDEFRRRSQKLGTYHLRNGAGEMVHAYELASAIGKYGDTGTLSRAELLGLLRDRIGNAPVRMGTTVTAIEQTEREATVTCSDGTSAAYDLVVGADGIGSGVRQLLFGPIAPYSTGWGGWLWWAPPGAIPADDVTEYWGAGRFVGLYPTRERICVFAGGPIKHIGLPTGAGRRDHVLSLFAELVAPLRPVFDALPADGEEIFFWKLDDVRAPDWRRGRVVLLGDAATAFLPTAGVGASMALESAAVLADELLRVEAPTVERALRLFELRHRKRVESIQSASRTLAKASLIESSPLAWARDELMKHYSVENLVKSIMKSLDEPI